MQAKCINDHSEEYPDFKGKLSSNKFAGLTKDKLYEVEQAKLYEGYFEVINDLGIKENYKKERFESMNSNFKECLNKECKPNVESKCRDGRINSLSMIECRRRIEPPKNKEYYELKKENEELLGKYQLEKTNVLENENKIYALEELLAAYEDHNKIFSEENERLKEENKELQVMISDQDKSANELREKFDIADTERCQYYIENGDLRKVIKDMKAEINQLRDELQQSEFEIKKYKASEIGYKTIIVNLIEVNKELARNIYVEELED